MSGQYRIQDRTYQRIAKKNKQLSNKKSYNRRKKGIELNPLFQAVKPSDFKNAQEVKEYERNLDKFLKNQYVKGRDGTPLTEKSYNKFLKEIKRIEKTQAKERKRIEELQTKKHGETLGMTVGERMKFAPSGIFPALAPLSKSLNRFKSEEELLEGIKKLQEGYYKGSFLYRHNTQYKENFLQSLQTKFGGKSLQLQKAIKGMNLQTFMNAYYETMAEIDIDWVYKNEDAENKKIEILHKTFGIPHISQMTGETP